MVVGVVLWREEGKKQMLPLEIVSNGGEWWPEELVGRGVAASDKI